MYIVEYLSRPNRGGEGNQEEGEGKEKEGKKKKWQKKRTKNLSRLQMNLVNGQPDEP